MHWNRVSALSRAYTMGDRGACMPSSPVTGTGILQLRLFGLLRSSS
jgi:hypothetical protein